MKLNEEQKHVIKLANNIKKQRERKRSIILLLASQEKAPVLEDVIRIYPKLDEKESNKIFAQIKRKRKVLANILNVKDIDGIHNKKNKYYVYLVENDKYPGWVKVGITSNLEKRLKQYNSYCPVKSFRYVANAHAENNFATEKLLIYNFTQKAQEVSGKEWFKIDKEIALTIFESV